MTVAYFDCFSGIAGDMILGALLNLGVDETVLKKELHKLPLTGYDLRIQKIKSNHITATDVTITVTENQHQHGLSEINDILKRSSLEPQVKKLSRDIFHNLGKAEAKIHDVDIDEVHFHEVGAIDSIIDIVGSVIGISLLEVNTIICSPLPLGHGFVSCEHGLLPLPAPATVELLKGIPVYTIERNQETVTPTGAAVITTLASRFGEMPLMKITRIGYGSGKLPSTYPNLLRVYLGELEKKSQKKNTVKKGKK
jgi:uncharacterized protein (TIGR00299 family) protein